MNLDPTRQAELERDEQWLASLLTPPPSAETLDRVRGGMRVAMDEQWLQSVATPAPPPELIEQVKAAVHDELRAGQRGVRYRVFGALSAAAVVLFAIGVARFATFGPRATAEPPAIGEEFIVAWNAIEDDRDMGALTADMVWLDEELNAWANKPASRTEDLELESLQDQIDQLFTMPDYFYGTS